MEILRIFFNYLNKKLQDSVSKSVLRFLFSNYHYKLVNKVFYGKKFNLVLPMLVAIVVHSAPYLNRHYALQLQYFNFWFSVS